MGSCRLGYLGGEALTSIKIRMVIAYDVSPRSRVSCEGKDKLVLREVCKRVIDEVL